jgi:hypothetical protein
MRELLFNVPGRTKPISLKFGGKDSGKLGGLTIISSIKYFLYLTFLLFLPVSIFFYSSYSYEQSSFNYVLYFLIIISGFYLFELIVNNRKKLIDPHSLLQILIFALLVTTAAVLVTPANKANTFGTLDFTNQDSFKGYAGISIILYIALYYYTVLFNNKNWKRQLSIDLLSVGFILMNLVWLLSAKPVSLLVAVVGSFLLIANLLFLKSDLKIKFIYLIGILISIFNILDESTSYYIFFITFISIIPSILISVLYKIKFKFGIKNLFSYLRINLKKIKNYRNIIDVKEKLFKSILFVMPIILIIVLISLSIYKPENWDGFEDFGNNLESSWKSINDSFRNIMIGLGSAEGLRVSGIGGILIGQGLMGLIAYVFLGSYSIFINIKSILKVEIQNKSKIHLYLTLLFINLFLIIASLFIYIGFLTMVLWWTIFSLFLSSINNYKKAVNSELDLSENLSNENANKKTYLMNIGGKNINLGNIKSVKLYIKYILALTLLFSSFILVYVISKNIGSTL